MKFCLGHIMSQGVRLTACSSRGRGESGRRDAALNSRPTATYVFFFSSHAARGLSIFFCFLFIIFIVIIIITTYMTHVQAWSVAWFRYSKLVPIPSGLCSCNNHNHNHTTTTTTNTRPPPVLLHFKLTL